jgi:hypothetical protein
MPKKRESSGTFQHYIVRAGGAGLTPCRSAASGATTASSKSGRSLPLGGCSGCCSATDPLRTDAFSSFRNEAGRHADGEPDEHGREPRQRNDPSGWPQCRAGRLRARTQCDRTGRVETDRRARAGAEVPRRNRLRQGSTRGAGAEAQEWCDQDDRRSSRSLPDTLRRHRAAQESRDGSASSGFSPRRSGGCQ